MSSFFRHGGRQAWLLVASVITLLAASSALLADTAKVRYERDVSRMVFNDNVELLENVRRSVGATNDTLAATLADDTTVTARSDAPYIVVSIADRRLWLRQGEATLFTTQVATGSGKVLEKAGGNEWKFETPRGRLVVQRKETDPVWVPPDWHYVEAAKKKGYSLVTLQRGQSIPAEDGSVVVVSASDVVRRYPDGREVPFESGEGREIVVGKKLVIPPFGTNQRKFAGVLGSHRLNLGDGYALHGTDKPHTVGQAVSHGCVRLRNEDIETLFQLVPVGTPVFIY
jgi:lipoprotein-anchoring transpeptidase ErfK/SrfK